MKSLLLFILFASCFFVVPQAQTIDSSAKKKTADTLVKKIPVQFNPRKATIRSAIFPGWGQIYNKKYWKLPLVWGAMGITTGTYLYNVKYYRLLKKAYTYRSDTDAANDDLVDAEFRNLSTASIRSYRNSFRQNVDYSVIFFILFWGLNVVDATVDAHLKGFNVDDNLSLEIKPGFSEMANTTGISLVLNMGKHK